ncbi:MAG: NADH dehydrogenase subunit L [Myxococcales bacterium]
MSTSLLASVCLFAPLIAFFVSFAVLRGQQAAGIAVSLLGGVASAVASVALLAGGAVAEPITWTWLVASGVEVRFGFLLDAPALLMGVVVAVIALCIQVYSLAYMAGDEGMRRYYAFLSLFAWSMLSFVYAPSLLQAFIFWELVGLASFLLIGFWFHKPSAAAAAKKAFLMTRIGDVGLFIGILMLFGAVQTLDIVTINQPGTIAAIPAGTLSAITLLLFAGIVGKSAQFPLHTWLPDAMEGPTPVSALLHSATMVAAGVFLFARFHPLFMAAPGTLDVVLVIATFTAIMSSTMATVALDMKRVLAFSSISQLGFMLMGLAAGSLFAGVFHLVTHAIFKALLFLSAGAFIHHHGTNDMVAMGRDGARGLKVAVIGVLAGGLALAGIPPLAGFWSKEAILHELSAGGHTVFAAGGMIAAFLTAYYTFRMIFLLLRPNPAGALQPAEAAHHGGHGADHGHGVPAAMAAPILLLAVGAVVTGFAGDAIAGLLGVTVDHPPLVAMAPAIGVALLGVALAWVDFGRAGAPQTGFVGRFAGVQRFLQNQWYLNELYDRAFVRPAVAVARACFSLETKGLDTGADGVALATRGMGGKVALLHSGRLQLYVSGAVLLVGALSFYLLSADWGLAP